MPSLVKAPAAAAEADSAEVRLEMTGQLRRCLALLRGCDEPGTRAQLEQMMSGLTRRLAVLQTGDGRAGTVAPVLSDGAVESVTPSLSRQECGVYAIQCEWMASLAVDPDQRIWLRGLARLWRALAASGS